MWDYSRHEIGDLLTSLSSYGDISPLGIVNGGLFVGAIRGVDTLVTEGSGQRWPAIHGFTNTIEFASYTPLQQMSSKRTSKYFHPAAKADEQFIAVYSDTTTLSAGYSHALDEIDQRPHKPIGIEVTQTSYAWSGPLASGFLLVDYVIRNVSNREIEGMCVGFYTDPDIYPLSGSLPDTITYNQFDDIVGMAKVVDGIVAGSLDTIMTVWAADVDGDPGAGGVWADFSARYAIGLRVLRTPYNLPILFNWFANDHNDIEWGPRLKDNRSVYLGSQGAPFGDRARYRIMTNSEIDYDQVFAATNQSASGWQPPASKEDVARDIADGLDTRFMVSAGPFPDLGADDSVSFTFAWILGRNLHRKARNFLNDFDYDDPRQYLNNLNFDDFITNARWASWIFDNPGVDTDGDGDRGAVYLVDCDLGNCDSIFYRGDGVPDYRGPQPPPAPEIQIITLPSEVVLRWSGAVSELERDGLTRKRDFEGYRLYISRLPQNDQFSLVATWDIEDYRRFEFVSETREWVPISDPQSRDGWRVDFGDPFFEPLDFGSDNPAEAFVDMVIDTILDTSGEIIETKLRERRSQWKPEDYNRSNSYIENNHIESNIIQQVALRDTLIGEDVLQYGVYEVRLKNLNAAVPLYFSIATFDFGDYETGLTPLAMAPDENYVYGQPINTSDVVVDSGLRVSVYPNPYKLAYLDGRGQIASYYREGYEGLGIREFAEQDRRIHFINLPDTAMIRIYTLDGDLVRTIHHPDPFLTTYSSAVGWDLVTRNVQAAVSGIYIWRVDSRLGAQMGKLVIIK